MNKAFVISVAAGVVSIVVAQVVMTWVDKQRIIRL